MPEFFFLVNFEQVFYEILFVWQSLQEQSSHLKKIKGGSSCSGNTWKINLRQFFLRRWRLKDSNLLEKFNDNNLAKVSFLKLLTKQNLLQ